MGDVSLSPTCLSNHVFTCMDSWRFIIWVITNTTLFCCFGVRPPGDLEVGSFYPSDVLLSLRVFWSTSFLALQVKTFHAHTVPLMPALSKPFSPGALALLLKDGIRNEDLGAGCACVPAARFQLLSADTTRTLAVVCQPVCTHTFP